MPFATCVVQHLACQLYWIRLIRISYLGWVKFHSFSSSWLNIASARPTHNTFHSQNSFSPRQDRANPHLYAAQSYCNIIRTAENGTKLHCCAMIQSAERSALIGLYTTSLLGVVQSFIVVFVCRSRAGSVIGLAANISCLLSVMLQPYCRRRAPQYRLSSRPQQSATLCVKILSSRWRKGTQDWHSKDMIWNPLHYQHTPSQSLLELAGVGYLQKKLISERHIRIC